MEKAPLVVIALWLLVFSSGKTIADTKVNNDAKDYIVATVDVTTITNSTEINFYKRLPVQYRTTSFENLRRSENNLLPQILTTFGNYCQYFWKT